MKYPLSRYSTEYLIARKTLVKLALASYSKPETTTEKLVSFGLQQDLESIQQTLQGRKHARAHKTKS